MRNRYALCLLLLGSFCAQGDGQAFGELDINDVRASFFSNGTIGRDINQGLGQFEVPQGNGTNTLFTGGLWVGGIDGLDSIRLAATLFGEGADFFPGALTTNGQAQISQAVSDQYDHVWSATRTEITAHLAYFNCLADAGCDLTAEYPDGYSVPASFFEWPAVNSNAGYANYLAPFYDFDNDGDYNPSSGDAPCILGDQALFFVFNDKLSSHTESGAQPIGIEVQAMPFAFSTLSPALSQTVFIRYHLINRSTLSLTGTHFGQFLAMQLGCPADDLVGSDPSRNLVYVYNRDDLDDCPQGYGVQPPAFGVTLLKGPLLDPTGYDEPGIPELPSWNGKGFGDGIPDNERHGLTYSMRSHPANSNCCNDPQTSPNFWNYLRGIWKDGVLLTYGGMGHSLDTTALPTHFIYPGDSDPLGIGTNGIPQAPWAADEFTPSGGRVTSSTGPIELEPGEHVDLLFALVYARAGSGGPLASVAALQQRVDSVRAFASALPIWNSFAQDGFNDQCQDFPFLSIEEPTGQLLQLFPNPANSSVQLQADASLNGQILRVHDATGRLVSTHRLAQGPNEIDIAALAQGVYSCEVRSAKARYTGRLVKE